MCELLCQLACGEGRTTAKDIQHAVSTIKSSLGCSILGLLDFLVTPTAYNNFWPLAGGVARQPSCQMRLPLSAAPKCVATELLALK